MAQPPKDYPVTGLCVVADPGKCPPGYDLLYYSEDKKDDCDLWKDSLFKQKVTRYLCMTRIFPLDSGKLNNVLVDLVIQNEREIPPANYTLLENTIDSGEKATRKKQICVKMIPRTSTTNAITELTILSRSKRAPAGYTLAGEINGLLFCFKYGTVPPSKTGTQPASPTTPVTPVTPGGLNNSQTNSYFRGSHVAADSHQGSSQPQLTKPSNNHLHSYPLSGVPFQINPKYSASGGVSATPVTHVNYRSQVDIENEYSYPFRLERGAVLNKNL